MSDMPMRLKYLTKMKIILCIFLLYITVSVFGEPQELNGILGESVKFPTAVKIEGSWMYRNVNLGTVTSGRFTPPHNVEYSDRVHWDSSTGLFSLSGLRMEDSGVYTVQDTHQNINTVFQLNVNKDNVPVSKPHVSITRNEYPCTLQCTVERGTGATLSWYREGEEKPYGSYPVRDAPYLHLPVPVERSGVYTCKAKNSVSNEKASITVGAHCTAPSSPSAGTIVASVIAVVAVFTAGFFALKYRHKQAVLRDVKQLLQNVVLHANEEEKVELPPIAVRSLIKVIELLRIGPPHGENSSTFIQCGENSSTFIQCDEQILFRDVRDFIYHRIAPKTEFPLNQATPEFGTASAPAGGKH